MNDPRTIALITGVLALLTAATGVGQFLKRHPDRGLDPAAVRAFNARLRGWWILCAVLAAAFLSIDYELDLLRSVVYTIGVACGYGFAILLFAGIRERIEIAPVSRSFKGYPIAFITASLKQGV